MGLEKINDYKKLKGYTNKKLSKLTGISISSLDKITSGENTNPKLGTIRLICKALDCNMDDLLGDENDSTIVSNEIDMIKKYRRLDDYGKDMVDTVLNKELARTTEQRKKPNNVIELNLIDAPVSAGIGDMLEDYELWERVLVPVTQRSSKADYILRIDGDSMEPDFSDGDYVLIRQQPMVDEGQIGIFGYDGKGYVKKFGGDRLISLNKKYADIYIDESARCFGLVLGKTSIIDK